MIQRVKLIKNWIYRTINLDTFWLLNALHWSNRLWNIEKYIYYHSWNKMSYFFLSILPLKYTD